MVDWTNPLIQLKATSMAFSLVAILITCLRLFLRRARLWWDDGWAFVSMLMLFVQIASVWMHVPHPDDLPQTSRVAAYYLIASAFYAIIWTARLSILFSIMRIETSPRALTQLKVAAIVFGFCACFLLAQLYWVCEPQPLWRAEASPQCKLGTQVGVCQVVTDVLSDILLCVAPLRVIQHIRDRTLRRRLKIIFSTSIVTTIVSIVHVGYLFTVGGVRLVISAIAEDCVSLIVANVPVVLALFLRRYSDDSAPDGAAGAGNPRWGWGGGGGGGGGGDGRGRGDGSLVKTGTGFGFKIRSTLLSSTGWGVATTATRTAGAGAVSLGAPYNAEGQVIELPVGTRTLTTVDEVLSDGERSHVDPLLSVNGLEMEKKAELARRSGDRSEREWTSSPPLHADGASIA